MLRRHVLRHGRRRRVAGRGGGGHHGQVGVRGGPAAVWQRRLLLLLLLLLLSLLLLVLLRLMLLRLVGVVHGAHAAHAQRRLLPQVLVLPRPRERLRRAVGLPKILAG